MAYIQSYKGQAWLLPPSIEDMIPEDHICFLVEGLVDSLDYGTFDIRYSGAGHPAYHPRILLKLLIMGVLDRVRSSRRLARNARENIVYIYLSEKVTPDFRTISDFRKDNPDLVKEVFKHTICFAKEEGLLDLSCLATDGSKVKANASNRKVFTKEELEVLIGFVDKELEEWARQDMVEEEAYGNLRGSDQLSNQSKKTVQKAAQYYIKKLKEKGPEIKEHLKDGLEQARQEMNDNGLRKVSITDPESRFMKNKKGRIELAYNPQVTVERKGFILANDVSQDATDIEQLKPQVIQTEENLGTFPEHVAWSFDAGYFGGNNVKLLSDKKIDGYIPDNNESKGNNPYDKRNFTYDPVRDEYTCPRNQKMTFIGEHFDKQKKKVIKMYKGQACFGCKSQSACTTRKDGIRYLKMYPYEGERNAMAEKMKTQQAKETYKLRQQIVEPVLGDMKENKGFRAFLTRGIKAVKAEFNIICASLNIKRIWTSLRKINRGRREILYQPV
jgi:transposase